MRFEGQFVMVPFSAIRGDARLHSAERDVWIVLKSRADNKTGWCRSSVALIVFDTYLSKRSVFKAVRWLEKHGWLMVKKHTGRPSEYRPIVPPMTSKNTVAIGLSSDTHAPRAGVIVKNDINTSGTDHTHAPRAGDPCTTCTPVLYPLNYIQKINRETSSKMTRTKQSQSPDFSALFDSKSGHFVLGAAARQKLLDDAPNVDLDATLKIIEARRLSDKKAQPIQNVLAYLERCLLKPGCVMKKGALIHFDDGTTERVKVYTDEELNQREQREKARQSKPVSKAVEDLAAKWGS